MCHTPALGRQTLQHVLPFSVFLSLFRFHVGVFDVSDYRDASFLILFSKWLVFLFLVQLLLRNWFHGTCCIRRAVLCQPVRFAMARWGSLPLDLTLPDHLDEVTQSTPSFMSPISSPGLVFFTTKPLASCCCIISFLLIRPACLLAVRLEVFRHTQLFFYLFIFFLVYVFRPWINFLACAYSSLVPYRVYLDVTFVLQESHKLRLAVRRTIALGYLRLI